MLTKEDNELLTRTGPGTPMGELMRRYWQPVCGADELARSPFRTKEIILMGEELVVYRDRSGQLGVVEKYCAHRRASLAYGVVEEDGIRCQYHGWKYDTVTGACIEQPFEDTTHPEDNFRDKCGLTAYKVQELGGLVFVYMGPDPAPLLPRWGPLVWDNCIRDIAIAKLPCNWLQCQENSLDPVHTEHLHGYAGTYFKQILTDREPTFQRQTSHQKIGFDSFKYGIIKRRVTRGNDETHAQWSVGHPILFPNILLVGSTLQFRVPMTDETCLHISLYTWRGAPGVPVPEQDTVPSRYVPLYDENGYFVVDIQFNQDYMAWYTQGPIAKRDLEHLGESDKGIILFRQMLQKQVEIVRDGGDPTINVFRDPEDNEGLEPPRIPSEYAMQGEGGGGRRAAAAVGVEGQDRRGRPIPDAVRNDDGTLRTVPFIYIPDEAGYSADADKILAAMKTWESVVR